MNQELLNLYPKGLWDIFGHICDAPHPSKHETAVVKWYKEWAKENNIPVVQDETGNLLFTVSRQRQGSRLPDRPHRADHRQRMGARQQDHPRR